jgi:hypothetical protein
VYYDAADLEINGDSGAATTPRSCGTGLHVAVTELRAEIGVSRAVLLGTPEYAGALPRSFKNPRAADAHASLARVVAYLDADVVAACACIPSRAVMSGITD